MDQVQAMGVMVDSQNIKGKSGYLTDGIKFLKTMVVLVVQMCIHLSAGVVGDE